MVTLYLKAGSPVAKTAETAIPGDLWPKVKRTWVTSRKKVPTRGDLVLQVGKGTPALEAERFAARKGALLTCLPEAGDYVEQKVRAAFDSGNGLVLLDVGLMNVSVV